jgi:hypothetical protein
MGLTDTIIRFTLAAIAAVLYFQNTISGTLALVLGIFAIIFIRSSCMSFCPLYSPFGISTLKKVYNV